MGQVWIVLFTNQETRPAGAPLAAVIQDAIRPEVYSNVHFLEYQEEDFPVLFDDLQLESLPAVAFFESNTNAENARIVLDPAMDLDVAGVRYALEQQFGLRNDPVFDLGAFAAQVMKGQRFPLLLVLLLVFIVTLVVLKFLNRK